MMSNKITRNGLTYPKTGSARGERMEWRRSRQEGQSPTPFVLEAYREKRDSSGYRRTEVIELLCEYILYLEECLGRGNKQ